MAFGGNGFFMGGVADARAGAQERDIRRQALKQTEQQNLLTEASTSIDSLLKQMQDTRSNFNGTSDDPNLGQSMTHIGAAVLDTARLIERTTGRTGVVQRVQAQIEAAMQTPTAMEAAQAEASQAGQSKLIEAGTISAGLGGTEAQQAMNVARLLGLGPADQPEFLDLIAALKTMTPGTPEWTWTSDRLNKLTSSGGQFALMMGEDGTAQIVQIGGGAPASVAGGAQGGGDYFSRIAAAESGGSDVARNPNSTASGRYQFTRATWEGLGYNWEDRFDPQKQEEAMQRFTAMNGELLATSLGHPPNDAEMYAAHFFGADGARQLMAAPVTAPIESVLGSDVISANQNLPGKTVGEVRAMLENKVGTGTTWQAAEAAPAPSGDAAAVGQIPPKQQVTGGELSDMRLAADSMRHGIEIADAILAHPPPLGLEGSARRGLDTVVGIVTDFLGTSPSVDSVVSEANALLGEQGLGDIKIGSGQLGVLEATLMLSYAYALQPDGKLLAATLEEARDNTRLTGISSQEQVLQRIAQIRQVLQSSLADTQRAMQQGVTGTAVTERQPVVTDGQAAPAVAQQPAAAPSAPAAANDAMGGMSDPVGYARAAAEQLQIRPDSHVNAETIAKALIQQGFSEDDAMTAVARLMVEMGLALGPGTGSAP